MRPATPLLQIDTWNRLVLTEWPRSGGWLCGCSGSTVGLVITIIVERVPVVALIFLDGPHLLTATASTSRPIRHRRRCLTFRCGQSRS